MFTPSHVTGIVAALLFLCTINVHVVLAQDVSAGSNSATTRYIFAL